MTVAPRAHLGTFDHIHEIYYTTDDGYAELRPREEPRHDAEHIAGLYEIFARYEEFHRRVAPARRDRIHLVSVVGGLYGLNLIPLFRPREITFFDVNPHAVTYFQLIRRVWIDSAGADAFLRKLANADYPVDTPQEEVIRRCIAAVQSRTLNEEEGRSARSFLSSWRYALDHFDLTRGLLKDVPVHTRVDGMNTQAFGELVANEKDLWIYCSNIFLFVFFDLTFHFPENAALFASYFDKTEMLDLAAAGSAPVTVHCRLPMSVERRRAAGSG
jgi:hypothetical protein